MTRGDRPFGLFSHQQGSDQILHQRRPQLLNRISRLFGGDGDGCQFVRETPAEEFCIMVCQLEVRLQPVFTLSLDS
jgi:hypothetical protein